ncbi:serine/threonine-protein kinase [Paraoerskovia marina]|uniref:serine/threonine-protein kinase n=1 Tax=Paraoerskovia marina TaxID=545619 RepID=UPI0009DF5C56|nr:serine/threonine-protein kinase [Paraoerskovia marina]
MSDERTHALLPPQGADATHQVSWVPDAREPDLASDPGPRSSSSSLAVAPVGSSRTRGSERSTGRRGTDSLRLRVERLGAGVTSVPPAPVTDPRRLIWDSPRVPEDRRHCGACGRPVGRAANGEPGRERGFCPSCGAAFDFTPRLRPGDVLAGQYEVAGCLAHGGLGWVYLGRDLNVSGRWVVLKGLLNTGDAEAQAVAISERQFLAEVSHPSIVEIFNFVMHDEVGYTVMEYAGGSSLRDILDRRIRTSKQPIPVDQAIAYILDVLPAFSYLHDAGLLFCDFKPDNVIQQGDVVKLIDLGGVRRADDATSLIYGTVGYQAPEIAALGPSVASDIFTIGRTLLRMCTRIPDPTTTYSVHLPPVVLVPEFERYDSFYRLLQKACAAEPLDRFASVDELRSQLVGVLREVVATDAEKPEPRSTASVHFVVPIYDAPDRPLHASELPYLQVDETDPSTAWLAGVESLDPAARLQVLAAAPTESPEVHLHRARTYAEIGETARARESTAAVLALDPWDWRALWIEGLTHLIDGDGSAACAAFNAVYGQVPGELAPKLALATACEMQGDLEVSERLYSICADTDANYTPVACFALARLYRERGDVDAALAALERVGSTRASYAQARIRRAHLLVGAGRGLPALHDALDGLDVLSLVPRERLELRAVVLDAALQEVRAHGEDASVDIGGIRATEADLRDALEATYRRTAAMSDSPARRSALVDRANAVRRWTWW